LSPDVKAPYMTIAKARQELDEIERLRAAGKKWQDVTDTQIRSLKLYYTAIEKEYADYAPVSPAANTNIAATPDKKVSGKFNPK
jgi:NaMN:DMB phosphoribosyltransferase